VVVQILAVAAVAAQETELKLVALAAQAL